MLLIDLGNSRLKGAIDRAGSVVTLSALPSQTPELTGWRAELDAIPVEDRCGLIASVASPDVETGWLAAFEQAGWQLQAVRVCDGLDGLELAYADATSFGVDRWLTLLAARQHLPGQAFLVASVGTALVLDAIDGAGRHLGGMIALGPASHAAALAARLPQLPAFANAPAAALPSAGLRFGRDSASAAALGCLEASAGLIERGFAALQSQAADARLIVTGGGAQVVGDRLNVAFDSLDDAVLQGLRRYQQIAPTRASAPMNGTLAS